MAAAPAQRVGAPATILQTGSFSLQKAFWIGIALFILATAAVARPQSVEAALGAGCILVAALLSSWIWITGRAAGLPLFPIFAATHIYAFAFPLLFEHPIVLSFPTEAQLVAALTVTGFLLLGTAVWIQIARRHPAPVRRCLVLNSATANYFFLAALAAGAGYQMAAAGGWINLPPAITAVLRAGLLAVTALSAFSLSYEQGGGLLGAEQRAAFLGLLGLYFISTLPGLLLINAVSIGVVSVFGYTLGARRLPWRMLSAGFLLFAFLHAGKSSMREIHWTDDAEPTLQPTQYPGLLAEWISLSSRNWFGEETESVAHQSLIERASLMQLLLLVQTATPDTVPYLQGQTYAMLPTLLIPRIFLENKIASHEGTYLLNIHYGMQTREDTARTTIGFGLLNEAYANFGYLGVGGLAILLGFFYAVVARWSAGVPILSFRVLFAAIVASYSFQSEFSSGVYVAALFQSTVALCALAVFFMRTERVA